MYNNIMKVQQKQSLRYAILLFCTVAFMMQLGNAHEKIIVDGGSKQVLGLINRMIPIQVSDSVKMIHSATTIIPQDSKYIIVQPATVYPSPQKYGAPNFFALPTNAVNLIDELRTYQSSHYTDIVVFDHYIYLHLLPNKIIAVRQHNGGFTPFSIQNTYVLEGLTVRSQTKMYKIKNGNESQVLLVVKGTDTVYKLGLTQTKKYALPNKNQISHLQFISDNIFVTAQNTLGIKFYKIQKDQIRKIATYSCINLMSLNISKYKQNQQDITNQEQQQHLKNQCKISDLSFNASSSTLYILDSKAGVFSIAVNVSNAQKTNQADMPILSKAELLIDIKDCDAFDLVSSSHFVLMCAIGMPHSYIQEVIQFPNPQFKNQTVFVKKDPIYANCNLKDLVVNDEYFLIFDSYSIDIYWNSMRSGSFQQLSTQHTKQHFNMPGFEVFALKKPKDNVIYLVDSNILYKHELNVFSGGIYASSPIPISKQIKVQIPGKCKTNFPVVTLNKQINKNVECYYEIKVSLNIVQKIEPVSQQKVSMSLGAIILMLTVMLILTWICLVKYKGLQKHARNILQRHRQKSRYNDNRFTI